MVTNPSLQEQTNIQKESKVESTNVKFNDTEEYEDDFFEDFSEDNAATLTTNVQSTTRNSDPSVEPSELSADIKK